MPFLRRAESKDRGDPLDRSRPPVPPQLRPPEARAEARRPAGSSGAREPRPTPRENITYLPLVPCSASAKPASRGVRVTVVRQPRFWPTRGASAGRGEVAHVTRERLDPESTSVALPADGLPTPELIVVKVCLTNVGGIYLLLNVNLITFTHILFYFKFICLFKESLHLTRSWRSRVLGSSNWANQAPLAYILNAPTNLILRNLPNKKISEKKKNFRKLLIHVIHV